MPHCLSPVAFPFRTLLAATFAVFVALVTPVPGRAAPLPDIAELPGPVVIAGGGKLPDDVRDAFFALAGKDKSRIVVLTAAAADPKTAEPMPGQWEGQKPASVVVLRVRDHKTADDPDAVKPLADATGVWFAGGPTDQLLVLFHDTALEKAVKKVHARGGVIGGPSSAMTDLSIHTGPGTTHATKGFGFLTGFAINICSDAGEGQKAVELMLASHPALIGLAIGEGAGVKVSGRAVRVIGDGRVSVCVAAGAGKEAVVQPAKSGDLFDLYQLRRAAANRAAKDPFPPANPRPPVVEKGSLVIVGGGGAGPEIWKKFIDLAGGPDAPIVVIPTALEDPLPPVIGEAAALKRFGANNVTVLHTRSRTEADDPKFSEVLTKAKGVWFGGGRQWRFVDAYAGTLTEKRIHGVLARGGAIGGSSAGASIQSEYMPRGHPLGNTVMAAEGYEQGFGFLPGCAVDQHFFARKRTADMTGLMKLYPQYLGIGIDEGTAIVVTGSTAEVIGKTRVGFYDARKKVDGGTDYEEVKAGEKYDLKGRKKVE
ncbi:MAG: cyanophycinase [Gemmataceae bacterium]|nr:cyanophycinase [Gemmataceae bacterium]